MDPLWILIAFVLGFGVKQIGLPPLIGFLAAGFLLNAMGVEGSANLNKIADYGIYLLLFSIGLKLKIKSLFKTEILATASLHMLVITSLFGILIYLLSLISFSLFTKLDIFSSVVIAFALSFSSTVFAVKILEEKGESDSPFGKIAIGILVIQDIFAVIYLTISKGEAPSIWALALFGLVIIPKLLKFSPISMIINKAGHGELLVLLGILIPIGTAGIFDSVGLKPDLGALIIGVVLANHPKAEELSKAMLSFKDLFLVGFFLTIGLSGIPTFEIIGVAFLFVLVTPIKTGLFFILLSKFKLRARTATMTSLSLSNYSEFGLIVGAVGVKSGWFASEWLVVFAIALSISFVIAAPLNTFANSIYAYSSTFLKKFEGTERLPFERILDSGNATIIILGMGKMGSNAYITLNNKYGNVVLGIDYNEEVINFSKKKGHNVIMCDATDTDFWERVCPSNKIKLVVFAMVDHNANMVVLEELKAYKFNGKIAATASYEDEIKELLEAGADEAYNFYEEAGIGFSDHISKIYDALILKNKTKNI